MNMTDNTNSDKRDQTEPDAPETPVKAEGEVVWERPVAVAKDRNIRAWLIFLGMVCLVAALWTPLKVLYYRHGYTVTEVAVKRDADTFVAIDFYGVSSDAGKGSQDVSTAVFTEELRLLRERGYVPIGLDDVRAFYKEKKLLPRRAVLMTFEQSRKSSYFETRDLLQTYKWKAVMGVYTQPIHSKDAQALLWPYLRDMITRGSWDLAAQSERGFDFIETNPSGHTGPFFSTPQWLATENRYELPEEFNTRITQDHQKVIGEFEKEAGFKPIAFFFPYGDYGQYEERANVVRVINMYQVGSHYELGFILGQLALNTRNSDPRRLNRLLVNSAWTPQEFINKLDSFWPMETVSDANSTGYPADKWIGEWGNVLVRDAELLLRAIPPVNPVMTSRQLPAVTATTGAKAWLAGSDTFQEGFLSLRFQNKRGRFGVYLRSKSDGEYVYFSLDDTGKISLRQRLPDMDEMILATDEAPGEDSSSHELLICLRDDLFFARLDGRSLFGGRVLLRGESKPGLIAVGIWDPVPGMAEAKLLDTRIVERRDALVTWAPEVSKDVGYLTTWLNEHGYQFNVLSPPWLDIFQNAPITFPTWDRKALGLLARTNRMRIMPQVQIRDVTLLQKVSPSELVSRAVENDVQGLYIDAAVCTPEQVTPLVGWLVKLHAALREKKLQLVLKLPGSLEKLPSAGSILQVLPGVIVAGDFLYPPFDLKKEQVLGITRVMPAASDATLSLYYQLSDVLPAYNDVSPETKKEALRQKGFDNFTAGDYKGAIHSWEEWSKEDPRSAEALALIGDAWLRLNEPNKALDAYTKSLDLNPGQMNLAIRHSRLLEQLNRLDESADILNVYARAFPDSPAVTIAQAQWLERHKQRNEAREVIRSLVTRHPENIEARLILQSMLDESSERYGNMHDLLAIGRGAETHLFGFGRDIFAAELLAIPEASVFFDFVREAAEKAPNKNTRDLYQSFLPLTSKVTEDFVADKLSDNWVGFGGFRPATYGRYELRAGSDMSEAFLRLKKSELLRDGFLEVTLDESAGAFWIYARRSSKSMVRFGYDDEGYIRIQSWYNGELRTYESRPWLRPPGTVRLKLEIRGDGASGYVNDKPIFTTPLSIPQDVCYGWWSIAPFSPELGMARARISRIECGPLAPTIVFIPRMANEDMRTVLDMIRLQVSDLSVVAPIAFTQLADGTVPDDPEIELSAFKMFCTFHRLRLMPVVDLAYFSDTMPEHLAQLIAKHRLAGLILRVRAMPDEGWFRKMEKVLEKTTADLIVIQQENSYWPIVQTEGELDVGQETARLKKLPHTIVREIQRGSLLLSPVKDAWDVPVLPYTEWAAHLGKTIREGTDPRLVVVPRRFQTALAGVKMEDVPFVTVISPKAALPVPAETVELPVTNHISSGEALTNLAAAGAFNLRVPEKAEKAVASSRVLGGVVGLIVTNRAPSSETLTNLAAAAGALNLLASETAETAAAAGRVDGGVVGLITNVLIRSTAASVTGAVANAVVPAVSAAVPAVNAVVPTVPAAVPAVPGAGLEAPKASVWQEQQWKGAGGPDTNAFSRVVAAATSEVVNAAGRVVPGTGREAPKSVWQELQWKLAPGDQPEAVAPAHPLK